MIRETFLWASRSDYLGRFLPRRKFLRRAVRRFMPGEGREDAIDAARRLHDRGIPAVFTLLGENVDSEESAREVVAEYRALLTEVETAAIDGQISVKLTQLGLDLSEDLAFGHLMDLVGEAGARGSLVWIDMEDSSYREATLRVYSRVAKNTSPAEIGLCLQAYLMATPGDLEELLPLSPTVRLVKGAYAEPPMVVLPRRGDVDEAFLRMSIRLLESGGRAAFATHDTTLVARFRAWIEDNEVDPSRYEFQMLYGIRGEEQLRLAREGQPIRVLISYGPAWFPWYMRRLAERPANVWFVVKNLFHG